MVYVCHKILKGILPILTPGLHVSNLNIVKANLVGNSFLAVGKGFLEGRYRLLTRDVLGVIVIVFFSARLFRTSLRVSSIVFAKAVNDSPSPYSSVLHSLLKVWMFLYQANSSP